MLRENRRLNVVSHNIYKGLSVSNTLTLTNISRNSATKPPHLLLILKNYTMHESPVPKHFYNDL